MCSTVDACTSTPLSYGDTEACKGPQQRLTMGVVWQGIYGVRQIGLILAETR